MQGMQALAMAQTMAALGGGGGGGSSAGQSSSSKSSSSRSSAAAAEAAAQQQSASQQMMEIQRQAAEQLQRQYLLEMIPPGSWGGKKWTINYLGNKNFWKCECVTEWTRRGNTAYFLKQPPIYVQQVREDTVLFSRISRHNSFFPKKRASFLVE